MKTKGALIHHIVRYASKWCRAKRLVMLAREKFACAHVK